MPMVCGCVGAHDEHCAVGRRVPVRGSQERLLDQREVYLRIKLTILRGLGALARLRARGTSL